MSQIADDDDALRSYIDQVIARRDQAKKEKLASTTFKCDRCGRWGYTNESHLKRHMRDCKGSVRAGYAKNVKFTPHEDQQLLELIKQHGKAWAQVGRAMKPMRTDTEVRRRYLSQHGTE